MLDSNQMFGKSSEDTPDFFITVFWKEIETTLFVAEIMCLTPKMVQTKDSEIMFE